MQDWTPNTPKFHKRPAPEQDRVQRKVTGMEKDVWNFPSEKRLKRLDSLHFKKGEKVVMLYQYHKSGLWYTASKQKTDLTCVTTQKQERSEQIGKIVISELIKNRNCLAHVSLASMPPDIGC